MGHKLHVHAARTCHCYPSSLWKMQSSVTGIKRSDSA